MTMDLDTLLADADPANRADLDGPESAAAARLYRQITTSPYRTRHTGRLRASAAATSWSLAGLASAGLAAVVLLAVLQGSPATPARTARRPPAPAAVTVADLLARAANVAAHRPPGAVPGPGQYAYTKVLLSGVAGSAIPAGTAQVQVWLSYAGGGRFAARICDPGCQNIAMKVPAERGSLAAFAVFGFPLVSPRSAAGLPAGAAALKRVIAVDWLPQLAGYPGARGIFDAAGSFLAAVAQPGLRAALYRMIKGLPGIKYLGPMTDRLGRPGVGVGLDAHGVRDELIFDPATSAVLQEESVVVARRGVRFGARPASLPKQNPPFYPQHTVLSYVVYVTTGIVNSLTAQPPAPAT
jgi:hypothetical protein